MKPLLTTLAATFFLLVAAGAVEPLKHPVTLTVKRQLLDSSHDLRGRLGNTRQKTVTLRVTISNTSQAPVGESELSGEALIIRTEDVLEKVIKEPLAPLKVPALKPGERLTFDLGEIQLEEIEWANHKFEETLEEWKIVCTRGKTEIGASVSSEDYDALLSEVVPDSHVEVPVKPLRSPVE